MSDAQAFLGGRVVMHPGDCRQSISALADSSIDAIVCDPPYALESIVKRFGNASSAPAQVGSDGAFKRASSGFMGMQWDTGEVAFDVDFWREALRVLKPGGHIVAFSGTRTYHKMATAIEAAGFECRDSLLNLVAGDSAVLRFLETLSTEQVAAFFRCLDETSSVGLLAWVYGTGFPKSHDVAKGIDEFLFYQHLDRSGERARYSRLVSWATLRERAGRASVGLSQRIKAAWRARSGYAHHPATPEAAPWEGWGTALKPAFEPIFMGRKPLAAQSVAANVLAHGVGGLNVGGCRVSYDNDLPNPATNPLYRKQAGYKNGNASDAGSTSFSLKDGTGDRQPIESGRFPANILHDGSDDVVRGFPNTAPASDKPRHNGEFKSVAKGRDLPHTTFGHEDAGGSASRYFYSAKADADSRLGSNHPTVKPVDLMRWLVRLVTPKGGTVLDPFAGTGTTGEAAYWEGCNAILFEREAAYQADIANRMAHVLAGPDERKRARTKAKLQTPHGLPLFGGDAPAKVTA